MLVKLEPKMLYFIGLGLGDEKDISVRGLEIVKKCKLVFLEKYTSILQVDAKRLSDFYGREVIEADRECVESESDRILEPAKENDVSFLVVGDVFGATTHSDLLLRAKEMNIEVGVVHNASIMNAISCCGLQLYRFGEAVSIPFFTDTWRPDSFYEKIKKNRDAGLHTLCLLDIKVKEPDFEALARGRTKYLPPRYMSVNQCIEQLLEVEENQKGGAYSRSTICIGVARVGAPTQKIVSDSMGRLLEVDFGEPLHSFVIPGEVHEIEEKHMGLFSMGKS